MRVRTRFAPSPTGELHLGGLRTALYAWLHARHHHGAFFLRIEDTDRERLVPGSMERILATLRELGLVWDEGPDIDGPYDPYVQSERLERYRSAAAQLVEQGSAYRCDCSPERLRELRDAQTAAKQPTRYDGRCRDRADINPSAPHVIRFKIPEADHSSLTVTDLIHGDMTVSLSTLDDFVLLKSDGWPTYHLAHVVDDHEMATSDVIRGDEWLPSLPKHVLLFHAFGWEPPRYAHLPLLLNTQHKKLSKRDGDVGVGTLLTWCLPDALVNFVALLGWNPSGERDLYTREELVASFNLAKVNRSPAVVDFAKLEWMNGEYIRQLAPAELLAYVRRGSAVGADVSDAFLTNVLTIEQSRLKRLDRLPMWYFTPVRYDVPLQWKRTSDATTRQNLTAVLERMIAIDLWPDSSSSLEAVLKPWIEERKLGVGETLWPLRVALSGQRASPSPFELAWCFGKDETIRRIRTALTQLT
ncbi:glutamate--tRNA ligase [Candidatus Uhrbacteria bacterium]|nr:glutamate--tRNA ligase [Candidatus Uhrbacteria bacterium]